MTYILQIACVNKRKEKWINYVNLRQSEEIRSVLRQKGQVKTLCMLYLHNKVPYIVY